MSFDVARARDHFPALKQKQVYCDNAGGSQVLGEVITSIHKYLTETNVQLGASYDIAKTSTDLYWKGYAAAAEYINASPDEVVIGPSTTQLLRNLSFALHFQPDDELILSELDHETNIAPWTDLAARHHLTLKWWRGDVSNPHSPILTPASLHPLLTPRTRLVACTHASNVLGTLHDIPALAAAVHAASPRARLMVDGVAYAPHRQIDVRALGADFYAFSWYKVYGPHIALLYARREVLQKGDGEIRSLGNYFNPHASLANRLALAGSNYELTQALPAVVRYFGGTAGAREEAFGRIARHEQRLQGILLGFLGKNGRVTVYGETTDDPAVRVPTVSFTVAGRSSRSVVEGVEARSEFGFRHGHMYAHRLVTKVLGLPEEDGVVRISLVHYNSEDEVRRLVDVLKEVIG